MRDILFEKIQTRVESMVKKEEAKNKSPVFERGLKERNHRLRGM